MLLCFLSFNTFLFLFSTFCHLERYGLLPVPSLGQKFSHKKHYMRIYAFANVGNITFLLHLLVCQSSFSLWGQGSRTFKNSKGGNISFTHGSRHFSALWLGGRQNRLQWDKREVEENRDRKEPRGDMVPGDTAFSVLLPPTRPCFPHIVSVNSESFSG